MDSPPIAQTMGADPPISPKPTEGTEPAEETEPAEGTTTAPTKVLTEAEKQEKVASFVSFTGADSAVAAVFLEMNDWLLEDSVNSYFEHANQEKGRAPQGQYALDDPDAFIEEVKEKAKELADKGAIIAKQTTDELEKKLAKVSVEASAAVGKLWSWFSSDTPSAGGQSSSSVDTTAKSSSSPSKSPEGPSPAAVAAMLTNEAFHTLFPDVSSDETLIEAQTCALLQTYRCVNNSSTPELPIPFRGYLYISENFACFYVDDSVYKLKLPIMVSLREVRAIQHSKRVESKIRVVVGDTGQAYIFKDFLPEEFDKSLGILKHMWESAQQVTQPPPATETTPLVSNP
mmetsp:Transcript_33041/g.53595  ORF Transcript_33041/g.53595 Transcript_33041/m.53595 type:complete len:344 (+) Transcript_33041:87-1118(+)|eukprot:CAMPEP_0184667644 /NCGR_PEP_ID=MMETSP0308-20130426/68455_1 /TAXON_ID=38269 /ORGANISM="Gloeochaete witrockiana, Strain SAG 46.84" /LENGTH=343 /DNA_ID=CAMNT_0027112965 /DNA_START=72 /DNA_END=1103 /DNA_ORIENTATION=+